jgi:hypothetical protein
MIFRFAFASMALFFVLSDFSVSAQFITHGPIVSAVTPSSARMFVRTVTASNIDVELSEDSLFGSVLTFSNTTKATKDSSEVVDLTGLQPWTEYYYRVKVNGTEDTLNGHFRTAPNVGERNHYTFLVGSCSEYDFITKPWDAAIENRPHLFLHNGDFSYPDYMLQGDHRESFEKVAESWRFRYSYPGVRKALRTFAFDYVFDNHDGAGGRDNISGTYSVEDSITGDVLNFIDVELIPPGYLQNVFHGYRDFFPHYPLADSTEGIYHNYRYGNVEIFYLDVRSCGTQVDSCFYFDNNTQLWVFDPDNPGHTMIGTKQMQWLLNGLSNSTADWKLIVSGVMFNQAFRKFINLGIALQKTKMSIGSEVGTGFRLAYSFAYNWAGFPREANQLINHLNTNNIKDVVMLTGHVHTNVMDDGYNAGLPELNTGPFAGYGAELTFYIDSFMTLLGQGKAIDSLWNGGGQGVENKNFKSGFGRVDVHHNDSLVMRIIDEDNLEVSKMVLPHSSKVSSVDKVKNILTCVVEKVFPNPAKENLKVKLCGEYAVTGKEHYYLCDMQGRVYFPKAEIKNRQLQFSLKEFPAGTYLWVMDYGTDVTFEKIIIDK